MRTIAAVTVGRSDWGIYLPVLRAIRAEPTLRLRLIVSGAHLAPVFGATVREIEADGFRADESVDMLLSNDSPEAIAKSMGLGTIGFAQAYQRLAPDLLLVLGDRFEMHAAAASAVPFKIATAHIHGGEVTQGAIDDAFRHSITKFSHLHFVSTQAHARRVAQLGEEPWRITVSGAPGLDNLRTIDLLSIEQLEERLQLSLSPRPLLATFHPVTLQHEQTEKQIESFLAALGNFDMPIVITKPNADTKGQTIIEQLEKFGTQPHVRIVDNLGTRAYFSLMAHAAAMVGNSSSGIIESAAFELPTVNVGLRQEGRARSANVIDTECTTESIVAAIRRALSADFRNSLRGLQNIYGTGDAAKTIVNRLKSEPFSDRLLMKRFYDLEVPSISANAA